MHLEIVNMCCVTSDLRINISNEDRTEESASLASSELFGKLQSVRLMQLVNSLLYSAERHNVPTCVSDTVHHDPASKHLFQYLQTHIYSSIKKKILRQRQPKCPSTA